jgi:hypothetical protein
MADRKRRVEQAIAESKEFSALAAEPSSPAPAPKKPSGTKEFQLNSREKAEAAAAPHPRAAKSQKFRNRELQAGIAAGRANNPAETADSKAVPLISHKTIIRQGNKRYRAIPPTIKD